MKKSLFFILAAVFVALAIVGSLYLIPGKQEIALASYKDKEYRTALTLYEQEYKDGRVTMDTAMHLVGVYLQYAEVEKAIGVMEAYVNRNPNNLQARQELGRLYQYGQRPDDYLKNLEKINAIASSEESERALAASYKVSQDDAKNIPLMLNLLMKEGKGSPQEFRDLIRMLAAGKRYKDAIDVNQTFRTRFADKMEFADHELALRLYGDTSQPEPLQAYATSLQQVKLAPEEIARVANILLYRVSPKAALEYISHYKSEIDSSPELLSQYVVILMNTDQNKEAYALMQAKYQQGSLPPKLNDELFTLAATFGNQPLMDELRDKIEYASLDESELLGLIDLADTLHDKALLGRLSQRAEALAAQSGDFYLKAALLVASENSAESGKVAEVMRKEQSFPRRLQLAVLCARKHFNGCVEAFNATVPAPESLNDSEIMAVASVMRNSNRTEEAYAYLSKARASRNNGAVEAAWFPLAAIHDSNDTVTAYLKEHGDNLGGNALNDAYYTAMAHNKIDNAVTIAEFMYGKEKSDANRNLIAQAYLKAGRYEEALPMFRERREANAQAEGDYLFVLSKLARKNPKYANELGDYGIHILNGAADKKRRMIIIYALVDAGQQGRVMPYVKDLALASPDEWASLYAAYLGKSKGQAAVTAFWMDVLARHPNDMKLKSQIAYDLLAHGQKDAALGLFKDLAANQPPSSPLVSQLIYLWSPALPPEGIDWLSQRASQAASPEERTAWLKLMADGMTDDGLLRQAPTHPELLAMPDVEDRYLDALQRHVPPAKTASVMQDYLKPRIDASADARQLSRYGDVAESNGLHALSQAAYAKALKSSPNDPALVSKVATAYYGEADYSRAEELLTHYFTLNVPDNTLAATAESERPHFYYAELMRRKKQDARATLHYQKVIHAAETPAAANDTELQSMAARSYAYSGNYAKGNEHFKSLIQTHPADRQLRADYSAMLVELHQRKDAEQSLPSWQHSLAAADEQLIPLSISSTGATGYRLVDANAGLLLQHAPQKETLNLPDLKQYPWIAFDRSGRDQTLLAAAPGYQFAVMTGTDGVTYLHPIKLADGQRVAQDESFAIQNELIRSRLEVETGRGYDASQRARTLVKQHPDNPQVLGFAANVENYIGNPHYARKLINKAHALQPANEDITELQRGLERENAASVYIDGEWRRLGRSDMQIASGGGTYDVNDHVQIGIEVQNIHVESEPVRLSNGTQGSFNRDRQRGELFARYFDDAGATSQISLFANNDTAGVGLYHTFANPLGLTNLGLEYHRPNWDFVEGIVDSATRDRAEIGHRYTLNDRTTINGELGLNNYNTREEDGVTSTATVTGGINYRLRELPYVSVGYALDAEYKIHDKDGRDTAGIPFQRFPLDSREVHSLNLFSSYDLTEDTNLEGSAGFGIDRMSGDAGPSVEGRVTHYLNDRLSLQGRAGYGFRGGANTDEVSNAGLRLQYRY